MKPRADERPSGTLRPHGAHGSVGSRSAPTPKIKTAPTSPLSLTPSTIPGSDLLLFETAPPPPEPGGRIGRYSIVSVLGRGAMGMVLRAKDDILQRDVALKVILPDYLSHEPAAGLNFLREGEIVASLDHPHVVRVLDAGFDDGIAFLAFSFIDGPSFASLAEDGSRSLDECMDLLLPVLDAVHYAHQRGIVHGDLKPTNLILGKDYQGAPHPFVLDFGSSFVQSSEGRSQTPRARVGGTIGYQAPEWLEGRDIDQRADIFSLGCILYELLTGSGPFSGASRLSEASERARRSDFTKASERASCPASTDTLIAASLAPDPLKRPTSALEFSRRLRELCGQPV